MRNNSWMKIPRHPEGSPFGGQWMKLSDVDPGLLSELSIANIQEREPSIEDPPNAQQVRASENYVGWRESLTSSENKALQVYHSTTMYSHSENNAALFNPTGYYSNFQDSADRAIDAGILNHPTRVYTGATDVDVIGMVGDMGDLANKEGDIIGSSGYLTASIQPGVHDIRRTTKETAREIMRENLNIMNDEQVSEAFHEFVGEMFDRPWHDQQMRDDLLRDISESDNMTRQDKIDFMLRNVGPGAERIVAGRRDLGYTLEIDLPIGTRAAYLDHAIAGGLESRFGGVPVDLGQFSLEDIQRMEESEDPTDQRIYSGIERELLRASIDEFGWEEIGGAVTDEESALDEMVHAMDPDIVEDYWNRYGLEGVMLEPPKLSGMFMLPRDAEYQVKGYREEGDGSKILELEHIPSVISTKSEEVERRRQEQRRREIDYLEKHPENAWTGVPWSPNMAGQPTPSDDVGITNMSPDEAKEQLEQAGWRVISETSYEYPGVGVGHNKNIMAKGPRGEDFSLNWYFKKEPGTENTYGPRQYTRDSRLGMLTIRHEIGSDGEDDDEDDVYISLRGYHLNRIPAGAEAKAIRNYFRRESR